MSRRQPCLGLTVALIAVALSMPAAHGECAVSLYLGKASTMDSDVRLELPDATDVRFEGVSRQLQAGLPHGICALRQSPVAR